MSADQIWHGAIATSLLAGSAYFAWRRVRSNVASFSNRRAARILAPILLFSVTLAILLVPELWQAGTPFGLVMVAFVALVMAIPTLALTLMFELAASRMKAFRTRPWLVTAALLFGLGLSACLILPTALYSGNASILDWEVAEIFAISISSGLVWWSFLPIRTDVAKVFD